MRPVTTINDGTEFLSLMSDLKFISFLFNSAVCLYGIQFFRSNKFLRCATLSSVFGTCGVVFVTLHNYYRNIDRLSDTRFYALLVPIELFWSLSEFLAAITTLYKLEVFASTPAMKRRNHRLLVAMAVIFAMARGGIVVTRVTQRIIWNYTIYIAHAVYYMTLVLIDTVLTTFLIRDTLAIQKTNGGSASLSREDSLSRPLAPFLGFLHFIVVGNISRVIYMNAVILVIALTYVDNRIEAHPAVTAVQNLAYALKYHFGIIFFIDLLLCKEVLSNRPRHAPRQADITNPSSMPSDSCSVDMPDNYVTSPIDQKQTSSPVVSLAKDPSSFRKYIHNKKLAVPLHADVASTASTELDSRHSVFRPQRRSPGLSSHLTAPPAEKMFPTSDDNLLDGPSASDASFTD
ncbi:uncharacterized protein EV422DRAFT_581928 [Fimicolochytrium jonesii]|uniref:uncharacterized protein n=1 Tax=Fimicolochytrium jonesii TaxID=1396493 RepID=UPI0022FE2535|nr:uncharacterized protein EV422DRAFT_581928 [Fimicolochytrium jonesii]KAI8815699.1 hypothetical protein EV422DRAFT_581928 [Fimicolochytrium jonesii]